MLAKTKTKTKKCKTCKESFNPSNSLQVTCSVKCAVEFAKKKHKSQFKAETRKMKQKLKTKRDWLKDLEKACNEYIRQRDYGKPCISCGKPSLNSDLQFHAGHYKSKGAYPEMRFNPLNIHLQCAPCNNHLSGNIIEYRQRLINRIGQDKVEWIEGPQNSHNWTIDEIKEAIAWFKSQTKWLKDNPFNNFMEGLQ